MLLVLDNEVDPHYGYFGEALTGFLGDAAVYDYPANGGRPSLDGVEGIVVSGSTAGVYEHEDHPWMVDEMAFLRDVVEAGVPTLGICFGHQILNEALGGRVEHRGLTHELVDVSLADEPVFEGVDSVVPALHGDVVVDTGDGMVPIAEAGYYEYFATRHRDRPVWTTQFHPEFTTALLPQVRRDFGWRENGYDWTRVNAVRVLENFARLV